MTIGVIFALCTTTYIVSRFSEFEKMRDEPSALGYYLLLSGVVYREKRETVIRDPRSSTFDTKFIGNWWSKN